MYQIKYGEDIVYESIDYYDFKDYCVHLINENDGLSMNLEYLRSLGFLDIKDIITEELQYTISYIKKRK